MVDKVFSNKGSNLARGLLLYKGIGKHKATHKKNGIRILRESQTKGIRKYYD